MMRVMRMRSDESWRFMLMKVESSQQQKHNQQSRHHKESYPVRALGPEFGQGVGEHVKNRDTEDQSSDEADKDLHPSVR